MITLIEWVETQRKEGMDDAEIGMQLMQQGYHPDEIAEALRSPFLVEDDPNLVHQILLTGFLVALIGFISMLILRPLLEGSIWGIIFLTAAGMALFQKKQLWQSSKDVMAGLIVFMAIMVLGSGFTGVRFLGYLSIIILSPLAAYTGIRLLRIARAQAHEYLHIAQRPLVLLALLFSGLALISLLVRENVLSHSLFHTLIPNAHFINVHVGFAIAVLFYCFTYLYLYMQKFSVSTKELYPFGYAIIGYIVVAAIMELIAYL